MAGGVRVPVTLRPPGLPPRPGRAGPGDHRPHQAHPAQHPAQPHRHGLHPRRAGRDRRPGCRARPARGHRRGLRAPGLRRRARPDRPVPGHARADGDDQLGGQDVLVHRLEDRLGHGHARAGHRGQDGQAVPHVRQRRPVPVRDRRGPDPAGRVLRRAARRTCRPSATCSPPAWPSSASRSTRRRAPTSSPPTSAPLGERDGMEFCRALPDRAGVVAIPSAVFYDDKEAGPHPGPVRLLQAPRGPDRGPDPALLKTFLPERAVVPAPPDGRRRPMARARAATATMGQDGGGKESAVMIFANSAGADDRVHRVHPGAGRGRGVPRPDSLRGRIRARGWGLLLLPVAMAAAVMAGGAHGLVPAELGLAVLAIVFAPKLAAKLVPFGVLGLAVFGVHLAKLYRDGSNLPGPVPVRPCGPRSLDRSGRCWPRPRPCSWSACGCCSGRARRARGWCGRWPPGGSTAGRGGISPSTRCS